MILGLTQLLTEMSTSNISWGKGGRCLGLTLPPSCADCLGHGQHFSKFVICVVLFVIRVVLLSILMFYVLFMCKCVLPPGVNPIAVDKYINIDIKSGSLKLLQPSGPVQACNGIVLPSKQNCTKAE
jgi:hypothetical protein